MSPAAKDIVLGAFCAVFLCVAAASAFAQERDIDPNSLPPRARAFALYGPLGDRNPYGQPARPGCTWSRLQVPTAHGLRWVAHESCDPGFW